MVKVLKSKIHRATVTDADLEYEGSISIDPDLLEKANLMPYEQVLVVNLNTGGRFDTYVIAGEPGGGRISLNGGAARLGLPGDLVIIMAFAWLPTREARGHTPRVVLVDAGNRPASEARSGTAPR